MICVSCGCGVPPASHNDPRNIVLQDVEDAASAAHISVLDAASNVARTVNAAMSTSWVDILNAPHVSIDMDGTLTLALHGLCEAVNAKCKTQYTYFDCTSPFKDENFPDDPEANEWAQTFLSYKHGSHKATKGFYKAMPPDYGAIAAVRAMYSQGVYVHITTHRDKPLKDISEWWLQKWGVPYHEFHIGDDSKEKLARKYEKKPVQLILVDDVPALPARLADCKNSYIYVLRRPNTNIPDKGNNYSVIDTWRPVLSTLGVSVSPLDVVPQLYAEIANKSFGDPGNTQQRVDHGEFGPGSGEQAQRLYNEAVSGGFTEKWGSGITPSSGVQVGGVTDPLRLDVGTPTNVAGQRIAEYALAHGDVLARDDMYLGGWREGDEVVIEPSQNFSDRDAAIQAGIDRNQVSVWDVGAQEEISTGGTGKFMYLTILADTYKRFGDPGSTQEHVEHGWFSVSTADHPESTRGPEDTFKPNATPEQLQAARDFLIKHGVAPEDVDKFLADHLQEMYEQGLLRNGNPDWYRNVHDLVSDWVNHGLDPLRQAALLAATTAKNPWAMTLKNDGKFPAGTTTYPNLTAAATAASAAIDNPTLEVTQEDADRINAATDKMEASGKGYTPTVGGVAQDGYQQVAAGQVPADQLNDQQLGVYLTIAGNSLIPGVPVGMSNGMTNAVMIARGADPMDVLQGDTKPKEASFMANIAFPELNNTTTNDSHQTEGMLGVGTVGSLFTKDDADTFRGMPGGYAMMTQVIMDFAAANNLLGNQVQAVSWASQTSEVAQAHKTSREYDAREMQYRPFNNDEDAVPDPPSIAGYALQAPVPDAIASRVVSYDNMPHPPSHGGAAQKRYGDPGSTQGRDDRGEFTPGTAERNLEAKAIAHFGTVPELSGQNYVTPNGSILNLEGDGHYRISEVTGGKNDEKNMTRAIDAGFVRTSVDMVPTNGESKYSVVLEFSRPMTSAQVDVVVSNVSSLGSTIGEFGIDVPRPGAATDSSNTRYSQEVDDPSRSDIASMLREANAAAGGSRKVYEAWIGKAFVAEPR